MDKKIDELAGTNVPLSTTEKTIDEKIADAQELLAGLKKISAVIARIKAEGNNNGQTR